MVTTSELIWYVCMEFCNGQTNFKVLISLLLLASHFVRMVVREPVRSLKYKVFNVPSVARTYFIVPQQDVRESVSFFIVHIKVLLNASLLPDTN